jgi:feruloyl esterase
VLWSLIRWVEQGRAPERLVGAKLEDGKARFTRALWPFPQAARYDGKGPQISASSYSCVSDPLLVKQIAAH